MTHRKHSKQMKKILSLMLCIVQCMVLAIPAVTAQATTVETMEATSVALPEASLDYTSTKVTMQEESSYWWGIASQATAKIGDPITGISDCYSVIFDSPIEEGYANAKTSSYFTVNTNWASFDMGNQDLMFYLELPESASSIRMQHICMDSWSKYPAPAGMQYQYLAADGTQWVKGVMDQNNEAALTAGFKGFVRLMLNTATNATEYADAVLQMQTFGFRIGAFGGSYGAAKLGGVWFVSKGEAYKVSVDGGSEAVLTSADPLPRPSAPEPEIPVWNGDVMQAPSGWFTKEWNATGESSSLIAVSDPDQWGGIATQATSHSASSDELSGGSKRVFGLSNISVVDSPVKEGYFCNENKTYPVFTVSCAWKEFDMTKQDVMFYMELPEASSSIRFTGITCNTSGTYFYPSPTGMQMQYLSLDSREWVTSIPDGNKQLNLPQGFKGYIRMKIDTMTSCYNTPSNVTQLLSFAFRPELIGGEYGSLKFGGAWFVSKEDTRYISVSGGATTCLNDLPERYFLNATVPASETAAVGETSTLVSYWDGEKWWGYDTQVSITAGESVIPIGDQKSAVLSSPALEGYENSRTSAIYYLNCNNNVLNVAEQDLMFYVELPKTNSGTSSLRIHSATCEYNTFWLGTKGMHYQYLPVNGTAWVDGGVTDDNKQINLPDGFKGYIRLLVNTANNVADKETLKIQSIDIRAGTFGEGYGDIVFGGVWFVSKEDSIYISVDNAEPTCMIVMDQVVSEATSVARESDPVQVWDSKVTYTGDSQAQITLTDSITKISDRKAVVINSESAEGYNYSNSPIFRVDINAALNAGTQDMMFYVELPAAAQSLRVQDIACGDVTLLANGMTFKYLAVDAGNWLEGTIGENNQLNLIAGFKGYVRLALNTASNYAELSEATVEALCFQADCFGGELGALKLGGAWFVSKTDAITVSVDGADSAAMTLLTDPVGNVEQWNVVLQDDIAANFHVRVNANIRDKAEIAVSIGSQTVNYPVKNLTVGENGTYGVKANVAAAQMNDTITVQVINGDDAGTEQTYSIVQYAKTLLNNSEMSGYYRIVKEMLNYGGMAQLYFQYNTDHLANDGLIGVGANAVPENAENEFAVSGAVEGISLYGATLVFRSKTAVRYYFNVSGDASAHTFACNGKTYTPVEKSEGLWYVEIADINPQDISKSITVTVDDKLSVSYSPMNYIVRMNAKGTDDLKAVLRALYNYHLAAKQVVLNQDNPARYDLKVTSFNVGNWYHGVCNLDVYGAQENINSGITPDHILRAYDQWMGAFPQYDADVICMQEMKPDFYINNQNDTDSSNDVVLTAEEVLDDYFQVNSFTGATKNGELPMWMGMLSPNSGRYTLHDISTGHLCEDTPAYARAYMKGYVTVNGHEIAIYCVHLQPSSSGLGTPEIRQQAYAELIEMAGKDEYAIIMGDMNCISVDEFQIMTDAGFNMANCGRFGAFNTYEYGNATDNICAIDNIFTTSNIEIAYAECEYDMVGGSDHYPLSAYLMIKDEA